MKLKLLNLCCIIALFFCPKEQNAQSIDFGLSAGVSSSTVKVSQIGTAFTNTIHGDNIIGFEGGLFARLNMGPLFGKGMFLLAYKGGLSDFTKSDGTIESSKFSVGTLEIPLMVGLHFLGPIRLEVGPVINWIFHESHEFDQSIHLRKAGIGYRIGANAEFGILNLGLAYQGLKNSSDGSSTATYASPNELIFSLGILLSGSK